MCASTVPVHVGAYKTYDQIKKEINKPTFDGHAAVNFIIERAHAKDPGGRPLYVMTFGKVTNLAVALLKDPTIAPKIKAVTLMTRFPASLKPSADWTVSESNSLDDRYATAALLENAALELHIVPWPYNCPETPWGVDGALTPSIQEIYDSMPGLGPRVAPIAYRNGRPDQKEIESKTFTCFGDYSVALHKIRENRLVNRHSFSTDRARSNRPGFLDVAAPMVLKNPSYAIATVMGAPR